MPCTGPLRPLPGGSLRSVCSVRLSQVPQSGHLPIQRLCCDPHCWQMKTVRVFAKAEMLRRGTHAVSESLSYALNYTTWACLPTDTLGLTQKRLKPATAWYFP